MSKQYGEYHCPYDGVLLAGVDEAGRGPLVGSVVAAAVILNPDCLIAGLADSKTLSEQKREALAELICSSALAWGVGKATAAEIDEINILQASLLAMHRAVQQLSVSPEYIVVDGNRVPNWAYASEAVVKGDRRVKAISAASIVAKVHRDREMAELDALYPDYGFAMHKGYPTALHLARLDTLGPLPQYRYSYKPVANWVAKTSISQRHDDGLQCTVKKHGVFDQ